MRATDGRIVCGVPQGFKEPCLASVSHCRDKVSSKKLGGGVALNSFGPLGLLQPASIGTNPTERRNSIPTSIIILTSFFTLVTANLGYYLCASGVFFRCSTCFRNLYSQGVPRGCVNLTRLRTRLRTYRMGQLIPMLLLSFGDRALRYRIRTKILKHSSSRPIRVSRDAIFNGASTSL